MLIEARPWALSAAPLLRLISAELRVIPMHKAVEQHFKDIDHDGKAVGRRLRKCPSPSTTQILVDLANKRRLCRSGCSMVYLQRRPYVDVPRRCRCAKDIAALHYRECAETQSSPHIAAVVRDICAVPIHLSFRVSMAVLNRLPRH